MDESWVCREGNIYVAKSRDPEKFYFREGYRRFTKHRSIDRSNFNSLLISSFFFFFVKAFLCRFPIARDIHAFYTRVYWPSLWSDHYNSSASSFVNTRLGIISIWKTRKSIDGHSCTAETRIDNLFRSKNEWNLRYAIFKRIEIDCSIRLKRYFYLEINCYLAGDEDK